VYWTTIKLSVRDLGTGIPKQLELEQNYPNPFNSSTRIAFALPHAGFATLKVLNVLGEEVATLVAEALAAGRDEATWNATGFPSGVYVYH